MSESKTTKFYTGGHCFWPVFGCYLRGLVFHKQAKFHASFPQHQYAWFYCEYMVTP